MARPYQILSSSLWVISEHDADNGFSQFGHLFEVSPLLVVFEHFHNLLGSLLVTASFPVLVFGFSIIILVSFSECQRQSVRLAVSSPHRFWRRPAFVTPPSPFVPSLWSSGSTSWCPRPRHVVASAGRSRPQGGDVTKTPFPPPHCVQRV